MATLNVIIPWSGWHAVKELGEGGYGKVYEIERTQSGITDRAALKVIRIPGNKTQFNEIAYNCSSEEETLTEITKHNLIIKLYSPPKIKPFDHLI